MNLIIDNYIWFIICGFVLLMITIGYYAEKTGFGKKRIDDVGDGAVLDYQHDSTSQEQIAIGNNVPVQELLNANNNSVNSPFLQNVNEINNNGVASSTNDDVKIDVFDSLENTNSFINSDDNDIWKF